MVAFDSPDSGWPAAGGGDDFAETPPVGDLSLPEFSIVRAPTPPGPAAAGVAGGAETNGEVDVTVSWAGMETMSANADFMPLAVRQPADFVGTTLGGYRIESLLGRGGMGAVFAARTPSKLPVALKILSPLFASDPELRARFIREAKPQARLDHPRIVRIHAAGEDDGIPFIAMQRLIGGSLSTKLASAPALDEFSIRDLCLPLLDALDHAHSTGFVHRDIKPGNVLLDHNGNSFLSDFGLVGILGADTSTSLIGRGVLDGDSLGSLAIHAITKTGSIIGTPAYMSPEQCAGKPLDHRSDLYSFGCMMYRMICGTTPFVCGSIIEYIHHHITTTPTDPRETAPEISEDLAKIVLRLLEKDPDKRFAVAAEVIRVLDEGYADKIATREILPRGFNKQIGRPESADEQRPSPRQSARQAAVRSARRPSIGADHAPRPAVSPTPSARRAAISGRQSALSQVAAEKLAIAEEAEQRAAQKQRKGRRWPVTHLLFGLAFIVAIGSVAGWLMSGHASADSPENFTARIAAARDAGNIDRLIALENECLAANLPPDIQAAMRFELDVSYVIAGTGNLADAARSRLLGAIDAIPTRRLAGDRLQQLDAIIANRLDVFRKVTDIHDRLTARLTQVSAAG